MSHVSNRMTMLKFQNNRPYTFRSGGGCGFGCGCNNSIFSPRNFYMRPMGFGCNNGLFRAGMITNMVMGGCDCAMNWIGQILNWCGIGGGGQRPEQPTQDDADLKLLQNTLKDTDNLDYEVVKNSDGTYSVTVRDKEHPENNQFISGTKETILKELGYTSGPRETTTKKDGNKPTAEDVQAKIAAAMNLQDGDANKLKIPDGYNKNPEVKVDANGNITVTIKADENTDLPEITATGTDVDAVVDQLRTKSNEVLNARQEAVRQAHEELDKAENATTKSDIVAAISSKLPDGASISAGFTYDPETKTYKPGFSVILNNETVESNNGDQLIANSMSELLQKLESYEPTNATRASLFNAKVDDGESNESLLPKETLVKAYTDSEKIYKTLLETDPKPEIEVDTEDVTNNKIYSMEIEVDGTPCNVSVKYDSTGENIIDVTIEKDGTVVTYEGNESDTRIHYNFDKIKAEISKLFTPELIRKANGEEE